MLGHLSASMMIRRHQLHNSDWKYLTDDICELNVLIYGSMFAERDKNYHVCQHVCQHVSMYVSMYARIHVSVYVIMHDTMQVSMFVCFET